MTVSTLALTAALAFVATEQTAPPRATAIVKGAVVDAQTGAPVRRATVRILDADGPGVSRSMTVDSEGAFEFTALSRGRYMVTASRQGYLTVAFGARRANGPGAPIELLDGQTVEKLTIVMSRGGVISGRVLDEYGDPVIGVRVIAMQYRFNKGRRGLEPTAWNVRGTDDLGAFRLSALRPGQYYVQAEPSRLPGYNSIASEAAPVDTFYPNAADAGSAQRVTVAAGKETAGINIMLVTGRMARLRGLALMSTGEPFAAAGITLSKRSGEMTTSTSAGAVRADGTFEVPAVAAGQYVVAIRPNSYGPDDNPEMGRITLTVTGDDIDDIAIVGGRGAVVRGRVTTDTGEPLPFKGEQIRVEPALDAQEPSGFARAAAVNEDFTFELKGLVGRYRIIANVNRASGHWQPKFVRWRGEDITDRTLEFRLGQIMTDVEVVFSEQWGTLSGTVSDDRGQPMSDAALVLFSTDEERWFPNSRHVRQMRANLRGAFGISSIVAGEYWLAADVDIEQGQWQDPEFLRSLTDRATRVAIREGETEVVNVSIRQP